ncbi:hypothetical protein ACFQX6_13285 [Streptosporangium lutulentum]
MTAIGISPDRRTIVAGDDKGALRSWDARTGSHVAPIENPGTLKKVETLAFSPDGRYVVTARTGGAWTAGTSRPGNPV